MQCGQVVICCCLPGYVGFGHDLEDIVKKVNLHISLLICTWGRLSHRLPRCPRDNQIATDNNKPS